jgi:hypothetical protein
MGISYTVLFGGTRRGMGMSFDPKGKLQLRGNPDAKVVFLEEGERLLAFAIKGVDSWIIDWRFPDGSAVAGNTSPTDVINPPVERWAPVTFYKGECCVEDGFLFRTKGEALNFEDPYGWRTVGAVELSQYDTEEEDAT